MSRKKTGQQTSQPYFDPDIKPIEALIQSAPPPVQQHYKPLLQHDRDLAEIFRLGYTLPTAAEKRRQLNPLQAWVSRTGQVWVDVLLERKKEIQQGGQTRPVTLAMLRRLMRVHGRPGRSRFLSGKVKLENLPELQALCERLETARPVFPSLDKSLPAAHADRAALQQQLPNLPAPYGQGVIIGVVDVEGCDFRHPHFRTPAGARLLFLWDQDGAGRNKPQNYGYGVEYDQPAINAALQAGDAAAYATLGYRPENKAHGTHVMAIAAGNSASAPGVAPGADLIFVHVGQAAQTRASETETLGSTKCMLDAVRYIFEKADQLGRPVVVNISLGGNGSAHTGATIVEAAIDDLLRTPNHALVVAAGNSHSQPIHIEGQVLPGQSAALEWHISGHASDDRRLRQELEIWYPHGACLEVTLQDPDGNVYQAGRLGEIRYVDGPNQRPLLLARHVPPAAGVGENVIDLFIDQTNPSVSLGYWQITLRPDPPNQAAIPFHAWVEHNPVQPSGFREGASAFGAVRRYTLNTIANGAWPVVVGAFDSRYNEKPLAFYSSAGPSRFADPARQFKPELCAPGEDIWAACATDDGTIGMNGTSMAAPHVTGVIAVMFQAARLPNPARQVTMEEIRQALIDSADPFPPDAETVMVAGKPWHPRFGFGYLNAQRAIAAI